MQQTLKWRPRCHFRVLRVQKSCCRNLPQGQNLAILTPSEKSESEGIPPLGK